MLINWNRLLARYQMERGGHFFGGSTNDCDSHLLLPQEERHPLLVWFDTDPSGRYSVRTLKARTMVQLDGKYELYIRSRTVVSKGVAGLMGAVGKQDFGYPEVTRGRFITTNNKPFTKQVLGDLELRNSLQRREKEYLHIEPGPQGDGWHVVEIGADSFEGMTKDSSVWVPEAVRRTESILFMSEEEQEVLWKAASEHFNLQMDEFLTFLRAAQRAVTTWRMT